MKTKSRRDRLRSVIQSRGFAALGELAESFEVSESTIRRDLEQLEHSGDARRTHGGVFWTGNPSTMRVFGDRRDTMWAAKSSIGRIAAELVEDHDTILLDGGSTTYELARHLVKRPLQVVTNSLPVAHLLSSSESIDLIMVGGSVRGRTAVAIGPMAEQVLHTLNVAKAFLSVAGITERGYFNSDMMLVESEKSMITAGDQVIVVTDSSKFGKVSLSRICGLGEVNAVVTDSGINSQWKQRLENEGVGLVLASTPSSFSRTKQDESKETE
ncbi:DeoR/GlpR family DNA-binding transcription regulator [Novipirellula artificiosorum]|uniref:DeoR/GlpR family DNA-binding transcription regulator n=1 Tax=Novipirellula artificiosorum TaxID=2528016 RepID=UPI0011B76617|nr:DeoR/GlpR family DNA-binding transcription regulator [Novipirellula artificiosorum]